MHVKSREEWEAERPELVEGLREFADVMRRAPFQNRAGLRGVSAFALWWFLRRSEPQVVIESGVWKGFSTWLIEQAAPQAEIFCFDPIIYLKRYVSWRLGRTYRSRRAHYLVQDFSCAPIPEYIAGRKRVLAFFDDHQNKWPRLMQCRQFGIEEIVFDDNYRTRVTHRTLEEEPRELLATQIAEYQIFPALWPVDFRYPGIHIVEEGLHFPREKRLEPIYRERKWHSYVTYVSLHPRGLPAD